MNIVNNLVASGTELSHRPTGLVIRLVDDQRMPIAVLAEWMTPYNEVRWRTDQAEKVSFEISLPISDWTVVERTRFSGLDPDDSMLVQGTARKDVDTEETIITVDSLVASIRIVIRKLIYEEMMAARGSRGPFRQAVDAYRANLVTESRN